MWFDLQGRLESGGDQGCRYITGGECVPFHSQPQHKAHVRSFLVCHFCHCEGFLIIETRKNTNNTCCLTGFMDAIWTHGSCFTLSVHCSGLEKNPQFYSRSRKNIIVHILMCICGKKIKASVFLAAFSHCCCEQSTCLLKQHDVTKKGRRKFVK